MAMAAHKLKDVVDRPAALVISEDTSFLGRLAVPRGAPAAAPVSPCASDGEESAAPPVCITGRFRNVEDRYCVRPRVLGTGHHGNVRECFDRATGVAYAVKSVRKDHPAVRPGGLAREILLLKETKHENIVRLVDVFEDVAHVHLVTELCTGGELFDRIVAKSSDERNEAPCFAEDEAARIVRQLLAAVSHMHRQDAVHRDIKPENVLFGSPDEGSPVKLIDFGLSRGHGPRDPPMTAVVGTPYYIAPEVLRRRYDRSCDLWSLGVVAYVLLCGYPPFNGADSHRTHRSVLRGRYRFPAEEWDGVSPEAKDFVRRLLRADPRERMTAEQAANHPWILRRGLDDAGAAREERAEEDRSSVEVVYRGPSSPARRGPAGSPSRRVRASMFGR